MGIRQFGWGMGGKNVETPRTRKHQPRLGVESLEGRALMTGLIADVTSVPGASQVGPMAVGRDGSMWFGIGGQNTSPILTRVTPGGSTTHFGMPNNSATESIKGIAADGYGNVWYAVATPAPNQPSAGRIGRVNTNNALQEFSLPSPKDVPGAVVKGPDGYAWTTIANPDTGVSIAQIAPEGVVTKHPVAGASSVSWLTPGGDGNLWFVDGQGIDKITPSGQVTKYALPPTPDGSAIDLSNAQLTLGSDGNIWFLGLGGLSRITPGGEVTTQATPGTQLTSLASGADGNLWFSYLPPADSALAKEPGPVLARMTTSGALAILPERANDSAVAVTKIVPGQDASLWLNEGGQTISRLNLAGVPTYTLPLVSPTTKDAVSTDGSKTINGTIVTFMSNQPNSTAADFTASIAWGDGQTSQGTVVAGADGGYEVQGFNVYASTPAGAQVKATVTINGPNSSQAIIYGLVNVTAPVNANPWTTFPAGAIKTPPVSATPLQTAPPTPAATPATPTPVKPVATPTATPTPVEPVATPAATPATPTPVKPVATPTATPVPAKPTAVPISTPVSATTPAVPAQAATLNARLARYRALAEARAASRAAMQSRGRVSYMPNGRVQVTGASYPRGPLSYPQRALPSRAALARAALLQRNGNV